MVPRSTTRTATLTNGGTLDYALRLEQLPLRSPGGAVLGTLSAFSYVADVPEAERASRPVLFLTNGGPGAASSYLHLSGIGPFRAAVPTDLDEGVLPPYGIEESPSTLLDVADLVFIDAPATGFGTVAESADLCSVYSVMGDAEVFATAIRAWVSRHQRWDSPKYFLGESYGTHRATFLASATHGMDAVPLAGIALLGQAVNIQEISERPGNVAGALANIPYKAAVAWFHGVGSTEHATVEDAVRAALDFAWGDLAVAMLQGAALPEAELCAVAERLGAMTGIPADELVASRLWMSKTQFRNRVLRDAGRVVGGNDGRYTSPSTDATCGEMSIDATGTTLTPRFANAFQQLFAHVFGESADEPYAIYDPNAARQWEWGDQQGGFMAMGKPSPFETYPYPARLSRWMKQVPTGRLFIGTGIYDSLTTIGAADHLVRQWDLPSERLHQHWYDGGHLMYSNPETVVRLNADLRAFLEAAR